MIAAVKSMRTVWMAILGTVLSAAVLDAPAAQPAADAKIQAGAAVQDERAADPEVQDPAVEAGLREMEERFAPFPEPKAVDPSKLSGDQKKLASRVQERWKALIAFDLKKVYSFATPAYRKAHDQAYFNAQYHNRITRKGIEILDVKFDDEKKTQARVDVKLEFEAYPSGLPEPLQSVSWEKETWVKVDGQWWFVEPR